MAPVVTTYDASCRSVSRDLYCDQYAQSDRKMGNMCMRRPPSSHPDEELGFNPRAYSDLPSAHDDPLTAATAAAAPLLIGKPASAAATRTPIAPWDAATSAALDADRHYRDPWVTPIEAPARVSVTSGGLMRVISADAASGHPEDAENDDSIQPMSFGGPGYSMIIPKGGILLAPTVSAEAALGGGGGGGNGWSLGKGAAAGASSPDPRVVAPIVAARGTSSSSSSSWSSPVKLPRLSTGGGAGGTGGWLLGGRASTKHSPAPVRVPPPIAEEEAGGMRTPTGAAGGAMLGGEGPVGTHGPAGSPSGAVTPRSRRQTQQQHPLMAGGYIGTGVPKRSRLSDVAFATPKTAVVTGEASGAPGVGLPMPSSATTVVTRSN